MESKNKIISGTLALVIMGVLILSGATTALVMNVNPDNSVEEGETANIKAGIDFKEGEHVPVQELKLVVESGSYKQTCTFKPNGVKTNNCDSDFGGINAINYKAGYREDSGFGYGYGYDPSTGVYGTENTSFTTGYGYGYEPGYGPDNKELSYNIKWDAPSVDENTNYEVSLYAMADDGSEQFTYIEEGASITVENYVAPSGDDDDDGGVRRRPTWDDDEVELPSANVRYLNVEAGQKLDFSVDEEGLAVSRVSAVAGEARDAVSVSVSKEERPGNAPDPHSNVYQYLNISIGTPASDVEVDFKVPHSWHEENNVAKENVALYHYKDNNWDELEATEEDSDDEYVYYTAKADGLSYFAIGEKTEETTTEEPTATCSDGVQNQGEEGVDCGGPCEPCEEPSEEPSEEPGGEQQPEQEPEQEPKEGSSAVGWLIALGIIVIGGIIAGVYYTRKGQ